MKVKIISNKLELEKFINMSDELYKGYNFMFLLYKKELFYDNNSNVTQIEYKIDTIINNLYYI